MIQQNKIQALSTNEIDAIAGGPLCDWLGWCRPPYRIDGGDPVEMEPDPTLIT